MAINDHNFQKILQQLGSNVQLVAVSKMQPASAIRELYEKGHRDFGENYVQELVEKAGSLPADIRWHFIGHLQSNKVKYIAPFIHLVQGVDSFKLLKEINKQAVKNNRVIKLLLQVHIAAEATKFGMSEEELEDAVQQIQQGNFEKIEVCGLMGMATFTDDEHIVSKEFQYLKKLFDQYAGINHPSFNWHILSMGMSDDYALAIANGSNMVRIGSLIFGRRQAL